MSNFTEINGSPAAGTGIVVLDDTGQIIFLDSIAATSQWNEKTTKITDSHLIGSSVLLCGNNANGVAVANGTVVNYLPRLGNAGAQWRTVVPTLGNDYKVKDIAGDNVNGFTVVNTSGDKLYQLADFDADTEWKMICGPVDFNVSAIAGDNKAGIVVVGAVVKSSTLSSDMASKRINNQVSRGSADGCSWTPLPAAPINIELISGNVGSGFLVYGENQLWTLDAGKGTWTAMPGMNFPLTALSGNPKDGAVGLVGKGDVIAYCVDVTKGPWCIALVLKAEKSA